LQFVHPIVFDYLTNLPRIIGIFAIFALTAKFKAPPHPRDTEAQRYVEEITEICAFLCAPRRLGVKGFEVFS
jgi:hypothetical protein